MGHGEDLITAEAAGTLDGLLRERAHRSPDRVAFRQFSKTSGEWQDFSWAQIATEVARWRHAMQAEGLQNAERVALLIRNSCEWVIAEQAALSLGLVVVPLYCDDRPENIAYILDDSAARLLVANDAMWRRIQSACKDVESLQRVVLVPIDETSRDNSDDDRVRKLEEWLPDTAAELPDRGGAPEDLATIVYTSGTTGKPKGVMLSHKNILSIAHSALVTYSIYADDLFLSFLPLSHTFERTIGYYLPMMGGATIAYARSITQLAEDMLQLKPTVLVAVPRIFERVHTRTMQQLAKKSSVARGLFNAAAKVGWWRFERQQGRGNILTGLLSVLLNPILFRLVGKKICDRMGGRLRLAVSGGAPLAQDIAHTLIGMGLTITQGYGLTETSPVISGNPIDDNDPDSVGVPLRGVEVRIGNNDELQVKTPGMMLGYWNNHAATAEIIDSDGWLHTGDQARIENKHIYITGRIKDILVLSNGEKVSPGDMEIGIAVDPLFEQVMIVGEGQSFLSAVIILNGDEWIKFANALVIDPYKQESLNDPRIHNKAIPRIRKQLHSFPSYAKVRRVQLSLDPWTVDNGLLTPTLKVKRNKVLELYVDEIKNLYS